MSKCVICLKRQAPPGATVCELCAVDDFYMTINRVQITSIPNKWTACPKVTCVYNVTGMCEDPRTYKGNGDALCHTMGNKALLTLFKEYLELLQ